MSVDLPEPLSPTMAVIRPDSTSSEDGVLNREKYEADRSNLPTDTTEAVLEGGSHAGFGSYGAQKGDGTPALSAEAQQQQTADALAKWINQRS